MVYSILALPEAAAHIQAQLVLEDIREFQNFEAIKLRRSMIIFFSITNSPNYSFLLYNQWINGSLACTTPDCHIVSEVGVDETVVKI